MSLLRALERYWDVEGIPKHDLSREEEFIDIQKANVITIFIVIFLFTITTLFVGGGML